MALSVGPRSLTQEQERIRSRLLREKRNAPSYSTAQSRLAGKRESGSKVAGSRRRTSKSFWSRPIGRTCRSRLKMRGMANGAVPISAYPFAKVVLTCDCGRGGRYDKSALIERTSPDEPGPTLRLKIPAGLGCEAARAILEGRSGLGQACRIYYPDLLSHPSR